MNQSFDQQLLPFLLKKYPESSESWGTLSSFLKSTRRMLPKPSLNILSSMVSMPTSLTKQMSMEFTSLIHSTTRTRSHFTRV